MIVLLKFFGVISLLISSQNCCYAQQNSFLNRLLSHKVYRPKPFRYSSLSLGIGSSHYLGDLSPVNPLKALLTTVRWNVSLSYSYTLSKELQIGANLSYLRLAGDDIHADNNLNYIRNLHFRNDIKQMSLFVQYHPVPYTTDFRKRPTFSPFVSAGISYFFHSPKAKLPKELGQNWVALQPLHTEGQGINPIYPEPYTLSGMTVLLGMGIRYNYNKKIDFSLEVTYNFSFTDYLDDVSGVYANSILFTDKTAAILSNRSREPISAATNESRSERITSYLIQQGLPIFEPFASTDPAFGAVGSNRGSKSGNDAYLTTSIKIHYILPNGKIRCPKQR